MTCGFDVGVGGLSWSFLLCWIVGICCWTLCVTVTDMRLYPGHHTASSQLAVVSQDEHFIYWINSREHCWRLLLCSLPVFLLPLLVVEVFKWRNRMFERLSSHRESMQNIFCCRRSVPSYGSLFCMCVVIFRCVFRDGTLIFIGHPCFIVIWLVMFLLHTKCFLLMPVK